MVLCLWLLSLGTMMCVTYWQDTVEYFSTGTQPSEFANVAYNTFARAAWGLALGWLIFACFHGYGGFVNRFLSWEGFGPLGKLAFNVYLVHYPLILLVDAQFTYTVVMHHILVVSKWFFFVTVY